MVWQGIIIVLIFLITMIPCGCIRFPRVNLPTSTTQTNVINLNSLINSLNSTYNHINTLKAAVDIKFVAPQAQLMRKCQALVVYAKEDNLYVKGYDALTPHLFSLTSQGGRFSLLLPRENKFYSGSLEKLEEAREFEVELKPNEILKSLFPKETDLSTDKVTRQEDELFYILSIYKPKGEDRVLERKIWINRTELNPIREIYYSPSGFVEFEIERQNFSRQKESNLAQEITIKRTLVNETLFLKTRKVALNPKLEKDYFSLEVPDNVQKEELE